MFTGIVEEKGLIKGVGNILTIEAEKVLEDLKIGDSVSVNGVCLTVIRYRPRDFSVEIMPETRRITNLGKLRVGDWVNLERAAKLSSRLGGHLLSGHIDCLGKVMEKRKEKESLIVKFSIPSHFKRYVVKKGSIAVDGVSLTVMEVIDNHFNVSLIQHTLSNTILGGYRIGYLANIEVDLISKYIEGLIKQYNGISRDFLAEHGYI
ncbi:MAG: riboflavin synthase [bacterium]|nr:riboflavin synthase [bacterium]